MRIQLEALAARVAAERMEQPEAQALLEELNRAEKLARQGRLEAARDHDINLHKRIIEATSNGRLAQVLSILDDQVHRIRQRAVMKSTRLPSTLAEHRAILDAILARDSEAAEKAMRDHLQAARDNAIELALAGTVF